MALEESILKSTKKVLGLADSFDAYDPDIIQHINSVLSVLNSLGIGPVEGLFIEDEAAVWDDLVESVVQTNLVKSWLFLRVKMLFDPPTTSFQIQAVRDQIAEFDFRLSVNRDNLVDPVYPPVEV